MTTSHSPTAVLAACGLTPDHVKTWERLITKTATKAGADKTRIVDIVAKAIAADKVTVETINQLQENGIPIVNLGLKLSDGQFLDWVAAGEVGSDKLGMALTVYTKDQPTLEKD